jgi:FkbH-like protein
MTIEDLHRAGRLAAEYPRVRGLLGDLEQNSSGLIKAGRLLARLDPEEVLREHPETPTTTVAITGHSTLSMLPPALTAELARHGLLAAVALGDFDGYVFELGDPSSDLYTRDPDLVLCVLDPAVVFDEVPCPWRPEDVAAVFEAKIDLIEGLAARFAGTARGTLVLNTLPLPRRFPAQLVDLTSRARLGAIWREANARLLRLSGQGSTVVVDLDPLLADGVPASDTRMSVYAKAHLSAELLAAYARQVGHLARHLAGRTKKTLAVDLDGTVWGGVLGEDGPDGIEVADSVKGEAFRGFQRALKQISGQGVLLAAVSKNDLRPVREVLSGHPRMTLREDDFVRIVANWRPKHDNLTELAGSLNVGLDSFVFVDDSPYECGLVRHALPDVAVIAVDDDPALHLDRLLADGWFDTRVLTDEDRGRVSKYRDELVRKDFLDSFDSLQDYLRELRVAVRLGPAGEAELARVSQLTLRTNQFNLTTRRLQPQQVRELAGDPATQVLAICSADRFGENGLVGVVTVRRDGDVAHLDDFLLSCRVFSRGIEQACLSAVLRHAKDSGARAVAGYYRRTPKNGMVAEFYPRYGFRPAESDGTFVHDLADIVSAPETVQLTASLGGPA